MNQSTVTKLTSESKRSGLKEQKGLSMLEKIKLNSLEYKNMIHMSPISLRNRRKFYFQQSNYSASSTMLCDIQSSTFYVDSSNSYLVFSLVLNSVSGCTVSWGVGSAFNLLRDIVITSRSGTEASRSNKLNLYRSKVDHFQKAKEWFETVGVICGYGTDITVAAGVEKVVEFCLPLNMVSPLFDLKNSSYLPPYLMSGLRMEITLESLAASMVISGAGPLDSYSVKNPALQCDVVKFNDDTDRLMTQIAHKSGLELYFNEWDVFSTTTDAANNITLDVRKTCSRANHSFAVSRESKVTVDVTADSFASEAFKFTASQGRVGSVYSPQQALTTDAEHYMSALYLFRGMKYKHPINVSPTEFNTNKGLIGVQLNRSQIWDSQSVPLNNSHSLLYQVSFKTEEPAILRQIDTFIVYHKSLKVYTNNIIVFE